MTAERADVKAYNTAIGAGWSADELRKIGFPEPDKKVRGQRRAARKTSTKTTAAPASSEHAEAAARPSAGPQSVGA